MPAISILVTEVQRPGGGLIRVVWEDGSSIDFPDVQALRDYVSGAETIDGLQRLWMGYWIARSETLQDATAIVGRRLTMDLSLAQPFRIV